MAKTNPFSTIKRKVDKVYRRLRFQSVLQATFAAIGLCSSASLAALLAFGLWAPTEFQYQLTVGIIAITTSVVFFGVLIYSLRQYRSIADAAEYWESKQPKLKDGLIACMYFHNSWSDEFRGSRSQAEQLADWVWLRVKDTRTSRIVPWSRIKLSMFVLSFSAIAWFIGLVAASDQLADGLDSLSWETEAESYFVSAPLVGDIHLTVDPPAYTGKARRFIPNSSGDIQVMQGSTITVRATSVGPVVKAFALVGTDEVTVTTEDERSLEFSFEVDGAVHWRFGVVTAEGDRKVESEPRRVGIIPDQAPVVEMSEPSEDLELENIRSVPVVFDVRDDIGLSKVSIHIALAGDEENSEEIRQDGFSGQRALGSDEIDLTAIEAQSGDRIAIWVGAEDNREPGGAQTGISSVRYITIRSPEFNHYEITESLHELVGILLDALADRLETEFTKTTSALVGATRTLNTSTRDAISQAESVLKRMSDDPLTADEITNGLRSRLQTLDLKTQQEELNLRQYPAANSVLDQYQIENISRGNDDVVSELESIIIYVEAMVSRLALEDIAAMTDEIRAAKARLADLIEAYKNDRTDALKARIMRNVKRLKSRIEELRKRLAKLRQKMPEEFLNIEGLKSGEVEEGLADTQNQLDDIEKMLQEDRLDDAMKALEEMSDTLDSLSDALNEDMQNLHDQTNPELQKALSELMDEARDLYKRQENLKKGTGQMAESDAEEKKKIIEQEMKEQMDRIQQLANEFRTTVDELGAAEFPPYAEEPLAELQEHATGIIQALDAQRIKGALESAQSAEGTLYTLRSYARMNRGSRSSPEQTVRLALAQDLALINAIKELLKNIEQRMNQQRESASMEQLRQSQQALAESTRRLRRMMNERSEMIPGLQGEPMESLGNAQESMGRAQQSLGQGKPGHAQSEQADALSQLKGLMKGLKKASQPQNQRQQGGGQGQNGRRRHSQQKVKIPTAEEHAAPAEFRKELMDAMKEKPPEAYRESVRRYYESLVE